MRKFEAMRKRHYEMANVKNLLGYVVVLDGAAVFVANVHHRHADDIDEDDDEGENGKR